MDGWMDEARATNVAFYMGRSVDGWMDGGATVISEERKKQRINNYTCIVIGKDMEIQY